jgi:glucokinase
VLLAGDIGGTKTDLALFTAEAGPRSPVAQAEFASEAYPNLQAIVREFVARHPSPIEHACFDVAGPVIDGRAKVTNLPWIVDTAELAHQLGIAAVDLLNDLEATALSIPLLGPADVLTLSAGEPVPEGAIAVVAPGTGLGEAFLTWEGNRPHAHASEGGHVDFGPTDATQLGLLAYLQQRDGHVSVERVCSGIGIPNIYAYLRDSGRVAESPALAGQLKAAEDLTPLIVRAAFQAQPDALSAASIDTFVAILGAEAGNLALKVLATGGVYLGGGIPKRILPALSAGRFLDSFRSKGRMSDLLTRVPVHVILEQTALFGAASYGLRLAGKQS